MLVTLVKEKVVMFFHLNYQGKLAIVSEALVTQRAYCQQAVPAALLVVYAHACFTFVCVLLVRHCIA